MYSLTDIGPTTETVSDLAECNVPPDGKFNAHIINDEVGAN